MRTSMFLVLITLLFTLGCGESPEPAAEDADAAAATAETPADAVHGMPADEVHSSAMNEAMGGAMHSGGGINAEVSLDPSIADAWQAIRVRVIDLGTMEESVHEIALGEAVALGDSGLTLEAVAFVPDFVMSEAGITSRSAEPQNPAAQVVISEAGKDDYTGWLFGAMPEIHAFPHDTWGVVLAEGIPAE